MKKKINLKKIKNKILITGGAGFLGSKLCIFLEKNYKIDVIDDLWFKTNPIKKPSKLIKIDVKNFNFNKLVSSNYYAVIILSGLSNDPMAKLSPDLNFEHNLNITSSFIYKLANSNIKKVIFGSSCSVYGNTKGSLVNEQSKIEVSYPYGISKFLIDEMIIQLNKFSKTTKFYSLRQGTICGFSPKMRFDLVINKMVKDSIKEKKIIVNSRNVWRPILDIDDACKIYEFFLKKNPNKGIYNIFSYNSNISQIANRVKLFFLNSLNIKIKVINKNKLELRNYKASRIKLDKIFKNKYKTPDDTISNIYENIKSFKNLDLDKYINVIMFKKKFKLNK
jgi:nucleoside-diphosphate-sugar epimerase